MRRLLIATLLVVPSIALAQRGGGGGRSQATSHTRSPDEAFPSGPALRTRDLDDMNPVKLLIDKRKDLKLTDAQLANIKAAEPKLKQTNEPLFKAVDSLVHEMRPGNGSDEDRARMRDARMGLMTTLAEVNANYDAAAKEAIAGLDADQQTKANELLAKQKEEGQKTVMEKLGGGGRRGGGDRPPV